MQDTYLRNFWPRTRNDNFKVPILCKHRLSAAGVSWGSCDICAEELDKQITQITILLAALSLQDTDDGPLHDEHNDVLSRYFPVEIITHIFSFLPKMQGYDDIIYSPQKAQTISSPFQLTSVCRRWREIAFGTPILWASLRVRINGRTQTEIAAQLSTSESMIAPWLVRAVLSPLKICVYVDSVELMNPAITSYNTEFTQLFSIIKRFASRWEVLNLTMPGWLQTLFFTDGPPIARNLRTLHLIGKDILRGYKQKVFVIMETPSLDTLLLSNLDASTIFIDIRNVANFSVNDMDLVAVKAMLHQAKHIKTATFLKLIYPRQFDTTHVVQQSLSSLRMDSFIFPFKLRCPNLESLLFEFNSIGRDTFNPRHAIVFIKTCGVTPRMAKYLTDLALVNLDDGFYSHIDSFPLLLELCPVLQSLRLAAVEGRSISKLLRLLLVNIIHPSRPDLPFLPILKTLTVTEWPSYTENFSYLTGFADLEHYSQNYMHQLPNIVIPNRPILNVAMTMKTLHTRSMSMVLPIDILKVLRQFGNVNNMSVKHIHYALGKEPEECDLVQTSWKYYVRD